MRSSLTESGSAGAGSLDDLDSAVLAAPSFFSSDSDGGAGWDWPHRIIETKKIPMKDLGTSTGKKK